MTKAIARIRSRSTKKHNTRRRLLIDTLERRDLLTGFSLQLLHASDLEAGLSAVEDAPNFAAVVQKLEESSANTILLSSGDNFIPGPFLSAAGDSSLRQMFRDSTGNPTAREGVARADIQIMNVIGFDASALGNHEFDLQPSVLATAIAPEVTATNEIRWQGAQFPYLSANLDFSGDASLSPWDVPQGSPILENTEFVAPFNDANAARNTPKVAPSTFITVGGEKIGVIGLTTPLLRSISSPGPGIEIEPLNPEDLSALAAIVNAEVGRLELIGSNKIILVSHLQQFSVEVALAPLLDGVDIIIAGGSDTRLADGDDILRPGDVAQGAYPILATSATNEPIAIVSTDGNYSYVGRLNADFDASGILMVECLSPANSGAYATDDAGVIRLWGNLTDPFLPGTKGAEVKEIVDAVAGVINTKDAVLAGQTGVYLEGRREEVRTQETNLGNITADANLAEVRKLVAASPVAYNGSLTRVSIKNGGGIRDSIGVIDSDSGALLPTAGNPSAGKSPGQVSQLDIENSLRFNNALSLITISAANLKRILEHGVAATAPGATPGQFPQVGGIQFSFDPTKPAQVITGNPGTGVATIATEGQRIRSLAIVDDDGNVVDIIVQDGQVVGDPNRQVQVVTLQFLIDDGDNDGRGGDNYPFPTFKIGNVVNTGIGEQAALKNYLSDNFPIGSNRVFNDFDTPAQLDERIQNLAVRSDTVIDRAIELQLLGRYQSTTGAEIVAHDPLTQKLFVVNGTSTLEVLDFNNPASPTLISQIDLRAYSSAVNSVAVKSGIVAAAVESSFNSANGKVVFLDSTTHAVLNTVEVGVLPDMLTFTPDGTKLIVANEGEPEGYDLIHIPTTYIVPSANDVSFKALLTVGEAVTETGTTNEPYRMVGIPDGMGAYDNGNGTFTLLMNHELGETAGVARAHGAKGAFVSQWIIDKATQRVVSGRDLITGVRLYDAVTDKYFDPNNASDPNLPAGWSVSPYAFRRLCSADLPPVTAFFNAASGKGTMERIFMNGEETGAEGKAFGTVVSTGIAYELPYLGKFSWENSIASPYAQDKTIVVGTDDSSPGQVYVYVGEKTNDANPIKAAGLSGGTLFGIKVAGLPNESRDFGLAGSGPGVTTTTTFSLHSFGDASDLTGAQLQSLSDANDVTEFLRPEDGAWDPNNPEDFYFVTTDRFSSLKEGTGSTAGAARLYRLRFNDIANPAAGGTIEMLIDGLSDPGQMFDNMTISESGKVIIQEDPGGQDYLARIWEYDIASGLLRELAKHNPALFTPQNPNLPGFLTRDEESSGVIDLSSILGPGYYMVNVQSHVSAGDAELVQDGQLLIMRTNTPSVQTAAPSFVVPAQPNVVVTPILTVGDAVAKTGAASDSYRMVGIPDGMGAYDNEDGTFTLLMNHELGETAGVARAHGAKGAFVSQWIIDKATQRVISGRDLITGVRLYDAVTDKYFDPNNASDPNLPAGWTVSPYAFRRLCSADLPPITAFYNKASGKGTMERIFMNGEETGAEGKAFGTVVSTGIAYELPYLGKFSWENSIASPYAQDKTIVVGTDDSSPGQVYVYVGEKTNDANPIKAAGLSGGTLFGIKVAGLASESRDFGLASTGPGVTTTTTFSLHSFGDASDLTGAQLQSLSDANDVTEFLRPEDGAWDPNNPEDFYFVTTDRFSSLKEGTDSAAGAARLYRLRFNDIANPASGGTIEMLIDGLSDPGQMFDNMTISESGKVIIQEDPGGQSYLAKIHEYDIATGEYRIVAEHNPALFTSGQPGLLTQDEESSGVIDLSSILGPGYYMINVQAHQNLMDPELVQNGQLLILNTSADPMGTVSIVDLSSGVASATAKTLDFTAYNGQIAGLRAQGIRIFGPNASVAQDLEPEYVTISADSTKAYVTLQENNAIAVVDLATQSIVSLLPLGTKDHSGSSTRLETYTFQNLPDLGTTEFGDTIKLGGFSGLMFDGINPANGRYKFITHTDRGPNGVNTGDLRPFPLPDFAPELVRFEVDRSSGEIFVTERVQLKRGDGTLLTGLPNIAGTTGLAYDDEVPTDLMLNPLGTLDPLGADLEGIVKTPDGNFWMVDEYRPAIYQFDADGKLIERFVPEGSPASTGTAVLPPVYAQRRSNRGFEAVAYSDGKIYAFIQSPLDNPDLTNDNTSKAGRVIRVLEFDIATKQPTGEYLYRLDTNAGGQVISDKIGDAVALGAGKFLVMERDDDIGAAGDKRVYSFSLEGATNTLGLSNTFASVGGKTVEQMTDAELLAVTEVAGGLKVLNKTLFVDLIAAGYDKVDKAEGLALIDSNTIAVLNDNDFQVAGYNSTTGKITFSNTPAILGIITLDSNALDASDREVSSSLKRINIVPQPVKGLYMPDAIASFTIGGETFLVTANEGDARDYDGYVDEERVGDVDLDNEFLPNSLKSNSVLGRLNVSIASGDANGDGKFEELFSYGSRSFSIWTTDGRLVYDSADDLEKISATLLPTMFNAGNENNTASNLDDRSDNKGPEPEAVTTMVIGGRTYALIGLERVGGVMVYDVTTPYAPKYVQYFNDRFIGQTGGDLGPEGLIFIPADQSPTSAPLLVSANEISKTVAVYGVNPTKAVAQQVGDTLHVEGTAGNDQLSINPVAGGKVEVKSGSTSLGVFDLAGLMQFKLYGYGGNDTLLVNPALNVNSLLSGGDGDDYLSAANGHDILLGGNGRDRLLGRGGSDLIIGGDDIDLIFGGLANDLLIGGTTAYDAQEAALFSILSEFRSSGLTPVLSSSTVFDDGDADSIFGEAGVDAFFVNTGDRSDRGRDAGE